MVSTRIFLSIPFSFATCSRMKPRFVSVVEAAACVAMTVPPLVFRVFGGLRPPRFGVRGKLENQMGPLDVFEPGAGFFAVDLEVDRAVEDAQDPAAQDFLAVGRRAGEVDLGELTLGFFEIARRTERPVETR